VRADRRVLQPLPPQRRQAAAVGGLAVDAQIRDSPEKLSVKI
jgi:hypothetical protein